jgi:methionyl-tRNA formyltransferase
MVPDEIIEMFPYGMLVMHPSLLPKYRGACPIQHAILNRETQTGCSVIEISKGVFDAGDVLVQTQPVPISSSTRFAELAKTLAELGGEALYDVLKDRDCFEVFKRNKRA